MSVISVHVRYYGVLALYSGAGEVTLQLTEGTTLSGLLVRLVETNPPGYRQLLEQSGGRSFLRVLLENNLVSDELLESPLLEGSHVALVPAISGGSIAM